MDLIALVEKLRRHGGDSVSVEAKSAAGGLPSSINSTLSAMANLPGGGVIILGLDENNGFQNVSLPDIQTLKQGLVGKARACVPPVQIEFLDQDLAMVDGNHVVVATVIEADRALKPVRSSAGGSSYIRDWDGDFVMSEVEERGFQNLRNHPDSDLKPVEGATLDDLDPKLLDIWEQTIKEFDPLGLGRFSGEELLIRGGVLIETTKAPTVAALLALGKHPQQFFPRFVVTLSKQPEPGAVDSRATNLVTLTGPIPIMLEGALDWARKTFSTSVVTTPQGEVRDLFQYPLDAFRELIGNALAHRDLASWSQGQAIEVRLMPDQLVITNPGGLYGISVDRLGRPGTTSARNGRLIELLKYTRTSSGARVVETLASGIPRVLEAAKDAGMPTPIFQNTDIRFTVRWSTPPISAPTHPTFRDSSTLIQDALTTGAKSVKELELALGLEGPNIRYHLRILGEKGLVIKSGGKGRATSYALPPSD